MGAAAGRVVVIARVVVGCVAAACVAGLLPEEPQAVAANVAIAISAGMNAGRVSVCRIWFLGGVG